MRPSDSAPAPSRAPLPPLPPIPVPARQRWRVFCTQRFPLVVFAIGLAVAAILWRRTAIAPALVAEAELVQAELRSAQGGMLLALDAEPFRLVRAGEVLGSVRPASPSVTAASLGLLRAELDALGADRAPVIAGRRLEIDGEQLRLEWMRERVALATLRVELQQAEVDFARQAALHARAMVSDEALEASRLLRDRLAAALAGQEELVAALAPGVSAGSGAPDADAALAAGLRVAEEKLRLAEAQFAPEPLVAPMDGVVVHVFRHAGETVTAGEPVLSLASPEPVRLVGYLRQPLAVEPRPGMMVELRTRRPGRQSAPSVVVGAGRVLEPVPPTLLALLGRAGTPELGLRVHLALPPGLSLRPGEQVDVMMDGDAAVPLP